MMGGLNIVDAQSLLKPGIATAGARNMECLPGNGYRRVQGYERYDGDPAHVASTATYKRIPFVSGGNSAINVGATVTGSVSAATARCLAYEVESGDLSSGTAVGSVYILVLSGTFVAGENLLVSGIDLATTSGVAQNGSLGDGMYREALREVRNYRRGLCAKPAGSGKILGVWNAGDTRYVVRNNAGGTAAVLHKTTPTGWQAIDLGHEIEFTNANASVGEGDTLTQGGVTATVKRVVLLAGSLSSGTNAGRLIISAPSGGVFAAGAATSTGGGALTLSGASTAITLLPNGNFEVLRYNFLGGTGTRRFYGCDGVNKGFEFDPTGDVWVPIRTGMPADTPTHVAIHLGRLWFSFPGGSLQWSSAAVDELFEAYLWDAVLGAGEITTGDEITAIKSLKQDQLAVACKDSVYVLYGSSFIQNNFTRLLDKTGCVAGTMNEVGGSTICTDAMGVYFLTAAAEYGDFKSSALSRTIQPIIDAGINNIRCAAVIRSKSQYRVYFGDKTGVTATFVGGKLMGWFPFMLAHQISCIYVGEDASGREIIVAGTDDGYLVTLDAGASFDGEYVESLLPLPFVNLGSPNFNKRWYSVRPEIETPRPIDLTLFTSFDYGGQAGSVVDAAGMSATGGLWGEAVWGDAYWGAKVVGTPTFDIDGLGANMRATFRHFDDVDDPWTIKTVLYEFQPTRPIR